MCPGVRSVHTLGTWALVSLRHRRPPRNVPLDPSHADTYLNITASLARTYLRRALHLLQATFLGATFQAGHQRAQFVEDRSCRVCLCRQGSEGSIAKLPETLPPSHPPSLTTLQPSQASTDANSKNDFHRSQINHVFLVLLHRRRTCGGS